MKNKEKVLQDIFNNDPLNILDISHDKGNKLIAEFMGFTQHTDGWIIVPNETIETVSSDEVTTDLKFHASWDWLMPVVEKIEGLDGEGFDVRIEGNYCIIQDDEHDKIYADQMAHVSDGISNPKIEATRQAIAEFIQWYNENK